MPHASGGGSYHTSSHSGGSHSSSSHSGGSHYGSSNDHSEHSRSFDSPPRRMEFKPFRGGRRFRIRNRKYIRDHRPEYIYASYDITERKSIFRFLWLLLFIPAIIVGIFMIKLGVEGFTPVDSDHYDVIIDDYIEVVESDDLYNAMIKFQETTNITPCLLTVDAAQWQDYDQLVDYAYNVYINSFDDETHWLFVYSQDSTGYDWEGMQGDDTEAIINDSYKKEFNAIVNNDLLAGKEIDEALTDAFTTLDVVSFYPSIDYWSLIIGIFWIIGFSIACYFLVIRDENAKYRYYEEV